MAVLHVGEVVSIRGNGAMIHVPYLAPNFTFGPLEMLYSATTGDRVIVGQLEGAPEDLVVLGKVDAFVSPYTFIYFFETATARNAVFDGTPMDMSSPTFAWVDDDLTLYVWTDETNAWREVSWDEARVTAIEAVNTSQASSISANASAITALATRATNLEGLAVSDTSTIDLTLSGSSWPKTLSAAFILNSITLDNLAGVVVSGSSVGQTLRHNGTNYVNTKLATTDMSDVSGTPTTGQFMEYNGTNWVPVTEVLKRVVAYWRVVDGVTKYNSAAEADVTTYTVTFATTNNHIYEVKMTYSYFSASAGAALSKLMRVASPSDIQIGEKAVDQPDGSFGREGEIKGTFVATGASETVKMRFGRLSGSSNFTISTPAVVGNTIEVYDLGVADGTIVKSIT